MRRRTTAISLAVPVVIAFIFFAPVVYHPAALPVCNFFCMSDGASANYRSISAQFLGQGATYWVITPHLSLYCVSLWVIRTPNCADGYGYFGNLTDT